MTIQELCRAVRCTAAYRPVIAAPPVRLAMEVLECLAAVDGEGAQERYAQLFFELRRAECRSLGEWLYRELRYGEFPYARLMERGGTDPALAAAARRDIENFALLAELERRWETEGVLSGAMGPLAELSLLGNGPFTFEELTECYRVDGAGLFAQYRAFLWEGGVLRPVADPDAPGPDALIGYELQRDQLAANTRAMLEGNPVNNVLLYGESGTGKSAAVKSLLNLPGFEELRLIEVQKEGLEGLPQLIRTLAGRRQKFILFIDDLAFDQDDQTYSALKTILEGGVERRPENVAVYATSNRRRLVRQTFSDRAGDEVDAGETIQEKTALSERFGLRIPYLALDKARFLALTERLAAREGFAMEPEELRARAVRWEMRHPGRTPRTAKQFIASLRTGS